jgi:Ca2+/Na+ antiporter
MGIGIIVVCLIIGLYLLIVLRQKQNEKKDRKWVFILAALAVAMSIMISFNVSLNFIIEFLNNTFGRFSRMIVNV